MCSFMASCSGEQIDFVYLFSIHLKKNNFKKKQVFSRFAIFVLDSFCNCDQNTGRNNSKLEESELVLLAHSFRGFNPL